MDAPVTSITGEQPIRLAEVDPGETGPITQEDADRRLADLQRELREFHDLMMAAESHALLIILEGMDAAGKDVTIENVHTAFNPQAARVKAFKKPVGEEEKHHFLWPADRAVPMFGEVVTFDRSYHEQAMPEGLGGEVSGEALERRFHHINAFEQLLQDEGTIVVKFFLHISKEAQAERLDEREKEIAQAWKISEDDWLKRNDWDAYMEAFERMMNATATPNVPWYVVPAEHQWLHNVAIAEIVAERMRPYREEWEATRSETGKQNQQEAAEARKKSE